MCRNRTCPRSAGRIGVVLAGTLLVAAVVAVVCYFKFGGNLTWRFDAIDGKDGSASRAYKSELLTLLKAQEVGAQCNQGAILLEATWPGQSVDHSHELVAEELGLTLSSGRVRGLLDEAYSRQVEAWLEETGRSECSADHLFREAYRAPWTTELLPPLGKSWIGEQSHFLDQLHNIHDCPQFYLPEPGLLDATHLPFPSPGAFAAEQIWTAAIALAMRSMYWVGNGDHSRAWQDTKACLALSCLPHCHSHDDLRCRIRVRRLALHCSIAIAASPNCDQTVLTAMESFISKLPDATELLADAVRYQRLSSLDMATRLTTHNFDSNDLADWSVVDYLRRRGYSELTYDTEAVEQEVDRWFDYLDGTLLSEDSSIVAASEGALTIDDEIPKPFSEPVAKNEFEAMSPIDRGKTIGRVLVGYSHARDIVLAKPVLIGMKVHEQLVHLTIELARYRKRHASYPDSLEELSVDRSLITDPFSDDLLKYRRIDDGFVLYSIYLNRRDDGGDGGDAMVGQIVDGQWDIKPLDIEIGEDLVVLIPIAPFRDCHRNEPDNIR